MNKTDKKKYHIYFPDLYFCGIHDEKVINLFTKVIKCFTDKSIYYFYLYREFGEYLTESELIKYRTEIPSFFDSNGLFVDKTEKIFTGKSSFDPRISAIGMLPMNKKTFDMLPCICLYYLDTTFFKPLYYITFDKYYNLYDKYNMKPMEALIELEITDFAFSYNEGLHICFDANRYSLNAIFNHLDNIGYEKNLIIM